MSSDRIKASLNALVSDLSRTLFFALNWHDVVVDERGVKALLDMGYYYNNWKTHAF